jgi:hypothetical protein
MGSFINSLAGTFILNNCTAWLFARPYAARFQPAPIKLNIFAFDAL